ncbi:hypothetical protein Y032_0002g767 [Ancylostoma ceylanicum]|uniref:Uncharacterized protein n=1 Tax=Ancylostoma ceylanicum TaxID=53326 RepID=A0A016W312_9BILA|nr:hypothetical protein Y032_0002g767 [Ancylostoma ceylanicum]
MQSILAMEKKCAAPSAATSRRLVRRELTTLSSVSGALRPVSLVLVGAPIIRAILRRLCFHFCYKGILHVPTLL